MTRPTRDQTPRDQAPPGGGAGGGAHPRAASPEDVAANLAAIRERIDAAAGRAGRDPGGVRLLPVSKTVDPDRIRWAYDAGVRLVGENKAQEARDKAKLFASLPGMRWAMIGHLQTNKVRYVAGSAAELHSLDRADLAEALERRLQREGGGLDVFVQVNTSGEASKYGLDPADAPAFVCSLAAYDTLRVRGLMTLAVNSIDPAPVRRCFTLLRDLRDRIRQEVADPESFAELSMGMSGDYELAVEEGATTVRVGQAVFGPRPRPDSYYWP